MTVTTDLPVKLCELKEWLYSRIDCCSDIDTLDYLADAVETCAEAADEIERLTRQPTAEPQLLAGDVVIGMRSVELGEQWR